MVVVSPTSLVAESFGSSQRATLATIFLEMLLLTLQKLDTTDVTHPALDLAKYPRAKYVVIFYIFIVKSDTRLLFTHPHFVSRPRTTRLDAVFPLFVISR